MTAARRSGRPSAISSVGLTGAPAAAAPVAGDVVPAPPAEPVASRPHDVVTSRAHEATTSRPRDVTTSPGRPPAPRADADTTISYTVRFDVSESMDVDLLGMKLRYATGRRTLSRAEIIRALLRMAATDDAVRDLLVRELTTS